jgi:hypothetical protein
MREIDSQWSRQPLLWGKVGMGMKWFEVGHEDGGEDRVSSNLLCGGLEVASPYDAV